MAAASGFLEDAVALDDFVESSDEAFAVFAVASSDLEQGPVLHCVRSEQGCSFRTGFIQNGRNGSDVGAASER